MTNSKSYGLVVDFSDFEGGSYQSRYSEFSVGPESDLYRLRVRWYDEGSTGFDSIATSWGNDGLQFSTYDRDNDIYVNRNCAAMRKGGWWYRKCGPSNPTGLYLLGGQEDIKGVTWVELKDNCYWYKTVRFTLKPSARRG